MIYNNIVLNNAASEGDDLYIRNDDNNDGVTSTINLLNNDFNQNIEGTYIQSPFPIDTSNLDNIDPQFDLDGYHLTYRSPCIDSGTSLNALYEDIDGDLRPHGSGYDIGADEYVYEITINDILAFFDKSTAAGMISGRSKNPCLANFKLWLFRQMLETAKTFIEKEKMNHACRTLNRTFLRSDGEPWPKDLIEGEAVPEIADMILNLMEILGCE